MVPLDKDNKAVVMTGNNSEVYKTDSRGNTWKPNIVDMGSYSIDTNMPNYYVPN